MKKNILLILSVIILIFSFLNSWYSDWLFNHLWLLTLLINIPLFIGYCVCLIFSIKQIMKKNKIFINYLPIIILLITAILTIFFPFRKVKTKIELILYEKQRNEIIEKVKNNEYSYYYEGNIKLPKYKYVSSDGEIYVYQNDENGTVIGFWIFRGMLSGSVELIYSDGEENLIRENELGYPIIKIDKLKDNWYYVETDY